MVKGTDNLKAEDLKETPQILLAHPEVLWENLKMFRKIQCPTSELHVKFHAKNRWDFVTYQMFRVGRPGAAFVAREFKF